MNNSNTTSPETDSSEAVAGRPRFFIAGAVAAVLVTALFVWVFQSRPSEERPDSGADETVSPGRSGDAEWYVEELTDAEELVDAQQADGFISPDQTIILGEEQETTEVTREQLEGMPKDDPIMVLQEHEQIEYRTPRQLREEANGDPDWSIRIFHDGRIQETTLGQLLEEYALKMDESLAVIVSVSHVETTTPGEVVMRDGEESTVKLVKEPRQTGETTLRELLHGQEAVSSEDLYYVHTTLEEDTQGIWGIVHHALIARFAEGIAIQRGEAAEKYQVDIPRNADERQGDETSSYLGQIIDEKVRSSYSYNLKEARMGQNPDMIRPGQEIIIVRFQLEELIEIYEHFVRRAAAE